MSQLYILLQAAGRLLGYSAVTSGDAAQAWRLDSAPSPRAEPTLASTPRSWVWWRPRLLGLLLAVELVIAVSGLQWLLLGHGMGLLMADFHHLVSAGTVARLCGL